MFQDKTREDYCMEDTALLGTKQIADFVGRPWNTIKKMLTEHGFPAAKINGRWESDKELIGNWRRRMIEKETGHC